MNNQPDSATDPTREKQEERMTRKQKPMFPEMELEILDDRKASRRERVQLARQYLRGRDFTWLIERLLESGPLSEAALLTDVIEDHRLDDPKLSREISNTLGCLYSLWIVGKLWRKSIGIHPGVGEESYLYGIKGVHKKPA